MEKVVEATVKMPIDRLSYSAMTQLLRNPIIFKMKYILGIYDTKMSVSGIIGQAGHEALKVYYGGNPSVPVSANRDIARGEAIQYGLEYLANYSDSNIEYGKTGSRETMLKTYTQAMNFYFAEEPEYHEILHCEEKMSAEIKTIYGDALPLPVTGIADLVYKTADGKVIIDDKKFTRAFTDYETEDYMKIIQAEFMFHLVWAATGLKADEMHFVEVKTSENKDGGEQVRKWVVPFNHEPYHIIFYNLFKDVIKFLSSDPIFLPNLSDTFDGEQAGLIYAQGLINADMSDVEVMHKVRDVAFASKKFVTSRLDNAENRTLLPEEKIKMRLAEFGIPVEPDQTQEGASVIQYRFKVSAGIPMSRFKKHKDDIARAIEAKGDVRIIAPIPGTSLVGVEVAREDRKMMKLSKNHLVPGTLCIPIGSDVYGNNAVVPLNEMPHLLVAGATGSGKSVFLHVAITALVKQLPPSELSLILIDPKRVELRKFAKDPHVNRDYGIIHEYEDAVKALVDLTHEMETRYKMLEKSNSRDITEFNMKGKSRLPYIVCIIDEFGDLMMRKKAKKKTGGASDIDVEFYIVRLAQMARAVGIHLILATQRPSVDVITGLIKANFPTRVALTTSSSTDSIVILGQPGAEKLSGKGDLLLQSPSSQGIQRLQGYHT